VERDKIRGVYLHEDSENPPTERFVRPEGGGFSFWNVPPGDYVLRAVADNYTPQPGDLFAAQKLHVGDVDQTEINLAARPVQSFEVTGRVVMEGGGTPIPATVTVEPQIVSRGLAARANGDGTFRVGGVLPGRYFARAAAENGETVSVRLGGKELLHESFWLVATPEVPLEITVSTLSIDIRGNVVDESGRGVPDAPVMLASQQTNGRGAATTDAMGSFRITLKRLGEYRFYVIHEPEEESDPEYLAQHENDFPVLKVRDGENAPVMLRLGLK